MSLVSLVRCFAGFAAQQARHAETCLWLRMDSARSPCSNTGRDSRGLCYVRLKTPPRMVAGKRDSIAYQTRQEFFYPSISHELVSGKV